MPNQEDYMDFKTPEDLLKGKLFSQEMQDEQITGEEDAIQTALKQK